MTPLQLQLQFTYVADFSSHFWVYTHAPLDDLGHLPFPLGQRQPSSSGATPWSPVRTVKMFRALPPTLLLFIGSQVSPGDWFSPGVRPESQTVQHEATMCKHRLRLVLLSSLLANRGSLRRVLYLRPRPANLGNKSPTVVAVEDNKAVQSVIGEGG